MKNTINKETIEGIELFKEILQGLADETPAMSLSEFDDNEEEDCE